MLNFLFRSFNIEIFLGGFVAGVVALVLLQAIIRFVLGHWREILIICAIIVACCAVLIAIGG